MSPTLGARSAKSSYDKHTHVSFSFFSTSICAPKDGNQPDHSRACHGREQRHRIRDMHAPSVPTTLPRHHGQPLPRKRSSGPVPCPKPTARRLHQPRAARHHIRRLDLCSLERSYDAVGPTRYPHQQRRHLPPHFLPGDPSRNSRDECYLTRSRNAGIRPTAQKKSQRLCPRDLRIQHARLDRATL